MDKPRATFERMRIVLTDRGNHVFFGDLALSGVTELSVNRQPNWEPAIVRLALTAELVDIVDKRTDAKKA